MMLRPTFPHRFGDRGTPHVQPHPGFRGRGAPARAAPALDRVARRAAAPPAGRARPDAAGARGRLLLEGIHQPDRAGQDEADRRDRAAARRAARRRRRLPRARRLERGLRAGGSPRGQGGDPRQREALPRGDRRGSRCRRPAGSAGARAARPARRGLGADVRGRAAHGARAVRAGARAGLLARARPAGARRGPLPARLLPLHALVEASDLPADRLRVDILGWRSRCHRRQRDWVSARDDVERALELSQALDDPELEANTLFQASLVCHREGNWFRARRLAEQARALYEQLDDRVNVGRQLNNLGGFEFVLGNTEKARRRLRQAYAVACDVGSTPDAAQALCSLAEVELAEGRYQEAEEHARESLALLGDRADFLDVAGTAQLRLGKALLAQGCLDEAEEVLAAAERVISQLSSASHLAAVWSVQGELALARDDPAEAARLYRRATETLQDFRF